MKFTKLLLLPTALLLAGCVESTYSGLRVGCVSSTTDTSIKCEYQKDDGSAIYRFTVKDSLLLKCDIKTTSGEINFSVSPKDKDSIFARSLTENGSFDIELPSLGDYKIVVNTNSHSGSYCFDWAKAVN